MAVSAFGGEASALQIGRMMQRPTTCLERTQLMTTTESHMDAPAECPGTAEPQKEHQWLQKLVGEWTYEAESPMGPGQPPMKFTGTESVRAIGDLWIMGEGKGAMPSGEPATTIITLGYDPAPGKGHYVGSWIGSMMTHLWTYRGEFDEASNTLSLHAEGPDMAEPGKTRQYKELIEIKSDDHRVFSSHMLGDDGQWVQIMRADYRRST
jgi:hypothetical protein